MSNVVHAHSGILFRLKKKGNSEIICMNFEDIVPNRVSQSVT